MILQPPLTNSTNIRLPYPLIVRSAGLHHPHVVRNPEHPQRQAVDGCPPGAILVMDSRKDPRAASAGDILVTRLQMRGVGGVVTDGGFRDAMKIAELEIPAYHNRPSSPTTLTRHQALDLNVPIGCGDVPVFPGDILVGADEPVLVIPIS